MAEKGRGREGDETTGSKTPLHASTVQAVAHINQHKLRCGNSVVGMRRLRFVRTRLAAAQVRYSCGMLAASATRSVTGRQPRRLAGNDEIICGISHAEPGKYPPPSITVFLVIRVFSSLIAYT